MALSGQLAEFSLSDILSLLTQQQKTGIIYLQNNSSKAQIEFHDGKVTTVRVGDKSPETVIRDVLIARNRLSMEEYLELHQVSRKVSSDFSKVLMAKGYIKENERQEWYQIAAEDLIMELFSWELGEYRFETEDTEQEELHYRLSADFLILEGVRQKDEWPQLRSKCPSDKMTFKIIREDFRDYDLGLDMYVLECVDGFRNIMQIKRLVPFGKYRLYHALSNLWDEKFITPISAGKVETVPHKKGTDEGTKTSAYYAPLLAGLLILVMGFVFRGILKFSAEDNITVALENRMKQHNIENAILDFGFSEGRLPQNLSELSQKGFLKASELKKYSGKKFYYIPDSSGHFVLK